MQPYFQQVIKSVFLFIQFFRDVAWERDILSLRVKCKMNERGCDWTGQLRHYEVMCSCVFAFFWLTDCPAVVDSAISYIKACLVLVKICIICDRDYCLRPETLGCTPFLWIHWTFAASSSCIIPYMESVHAILKSHWKVFSLKLKRCNAENMTRNKNCYE